MVYSNIHQNDGSIYIWWRISHHQMFFGSSMSLFCVPFNFNVSAFNIIHSFLERTHYSANVHIFKHKHKPPAHHQHQGPGRDRTASARSAPPTGLNRRILIVIGWDGAWRGVARVCVWRVRSPKRARNRIFSQYLCAAAPAKRHHQRARAPLVRSYYKS